MSDLHFAFGVFLLVFGIIKTILVASLLYTTIEIPGIDLFFSTNDHTLAGQFVEVVILAFALFTILHGLCILNVIPFRDTIESREVQYSVFLFLGLLTIIFYSCVLYSTLPIEKDKTNYYTYKVNIFLVGVSFCVVPFIIEFITPILHTLSRESISILIFFAMFIALIISSVLVSIFKR